MDPNNFEPPESYTPSCPYGSGGLSNSSSGEGSGFAAGGGDYSEILDSKEGWDLQFVPNRSEKYDCPICLLVLREPMQTECGHRFCKACILKWLRESESRCPIDNQPLDEKQLFPDNFAKREILALYVKCPNHVSGCDVVVVLKHLQEHHSLCEFSYMPCPQECADLVRRCDLQSHLSTQCPKRTISCPLCGLEVEAEGLQAHKDTCPLMITSCPHCSAQLKRQELPSHASDQCPRAVVRCPYYFLGCQYQEERATLGDHSNVAIQMHMLLISKALQFLFSALDLNPFSQQTTMTAPSSLGRQPQEMSMTGSATLHSEQQQQQHLSMMQQLLQQVTLGRLTSANFLSGSSVNVQVSSSSLPNSNARQILPQRESSSSLPNAGQRVPNPQNVIQSSGPTSSDRQTEAPQTSSEQLLSSRTREESEVCYTSNASNRQDNENIAPAVSIINENQFLSFKSQNELQDESLARHDQQMMQLAHRCEYQDKVMKEMKSRIKVLENSVQEFEGRFNNGLYVWKIKNYNRSRREAEKGETIAIHSGSFYSSFYGYKCCIRVNLNGVDTAKGTHLSLFIHFMQGDYDEMLDWPFTGRIILTIVDQNPICELRQHVTETLISKPNLAAFQRPVSPRNHKGFGYMEFVPLSVVDGSMYVRSDTLIIKAQLIPNS